MKNNERVICRFNLKWKKAEFPKSPNLGLFLFIHSLYFSKISLIMKHILEKSRIIKPKMERSRKIKFKNGKKPNRFALKIIFPY